MSAVATSRSEIGHFAQFPLHIARAPVSERAKGIWRELAFLSSPKKPTVWVRQENLAKALNVSTKTIQRAIKELTDAGLLAFVGWYQGRYKTYLMAWKKILDNNVQGPKTPSSSHQGQSCPNNNKASKHNSNSVILTAPPPTSKEIEEVYQEYKEAYKKQFPALDGEKGRPTLKTCIEQAMHHTSRHKYHSLKVYLDMWLQNASQRWFANYIKDGGIVHETEEQRYRRLNWDKIRAERDAKDLQAYLEREQHEKARQGLNTEKHERLQLNSAAL